RRKHVVREEADGLEKVVETEIDEEVVRQAVTQVVQLPVERGVTIPVGLLVEAPVGKKGVELLRLAQRSDVAHSVSIFPVKVHRLIHRVELQAKLVVQLGGENQLGDVIGVDVHVVTLGFIRRECPDQFPVRVQL